jgi:hypothetical protein
VQQAEGMLIKMGERMEPGQFLGAVKDFEHRVDAEAMLAEGNRAHKRRYLHLSERNDGMIKLDGLLDAEGGAIVRSRLNGLMLPAKKRRPDARAASSRWPG